MDQSIGVFDSGIGGLTVVRHIINELPNESLIYLGDTARVPYGNRDNRTIREFSLQLVEFFNKKKVKALVVACNTMSAVALEDIKKHSKAPVVDVITPTAGYVSKNFKDKRIGLIATRATINSKAYDKLLSKNGIQLTSKTVPLFVPLIEEGLLTGNVPETIAHMYLDRFQTDVLILGSTHYPLLKETIGKVLGKDTQLLDTGYPTALELSEVLEEKNILSKSKPTYEFYVTDDTKRTEEIAKLFFDNELPTKLKRINL